jgi:hypothetical protein
MVCFGYLYSIINRGFGMKYSIRQGVIAGLFGTLGDAVIHHIAYFIFKTTTTAHYIARLIFPTGKIILIQYLIGFFIHLISGAVVGFLLAEIYNRLGNDYPYDKGIGLGILFWIIHIVVIPNMINMPRPIVYRTELECMADLAAHLTFGIIATMYLIRKCNKI